MVHENSQFDISAIQLRESKTQPKVSFSREIGDAQIIHTIFGRAKVRIIRKNDKLYRALWVTAAAVVTAIAAVVLLGWYASQQIEPQQNADSIPSVSSEENASKPANPENMTAPAGSPLVKSEPITPPSTETGKPAIIQNNATQQPIGLKDTRPKTAKPVTIKPKPVTVEPLPTDKPQTVPAAANNVLNNPADKTRLLAPARRPATPAVATPVTVQPAASSPAAIAPPADPLDKQNTAIKSPEDDKPLSDPINVQNK